MLSLVDESPTVTATATKSDFDATIPIIAGVAGVFALAIILLVVLLLVYLYRRRQRLANDRADYLSGRPVNPPTSAIFAAPSQTFSTTSMSAMSTPGTYANLHLSAPTTPSFAVTGAGMGTTDSGRTGMNDALSERSHRSGHSGGGGGGGDGGGGGGGGRQSKRKNTRTHAEPESAPTVPYAQHDPNNERFAKFQTIEN
jgi:uncharacterized membrane protein YgcG